MPNYFPYMYNAPQNNQTSGFISVPNESVVASYPVAPGNCVTFKIEGKPIVMEKSMGFSQLEAPRIERYRLVKEDTPEIKDLASYPHATIPSEEFSPEEIKRKIEALERALVALENRVSEIETPVSTPKSTSKKTPKNDTEEAL